MVWFYILNLRKPGLHQYVYQVPSDSVLNIIHDSLARSRFPSYFIN